MKSDSDLRSKQYEESRADAKTISPEEQARKDELAAHNKWKAAKDYRTPPPGLIAMNYAAPAQRQRMRQATMNQLPIGLAAQGAEGNPTALALATQNMADTQDRDQAESYEGDLRAEDQYQRTGNSDALISQDWMRKATLYGGAADMTKFATQARINTTPRSILPGLLAAGLGAAGTALSGGFASGGRFSGGG